VLTMQQSRKMKPTIAIGGWPIRTIRADQHWILLQDEGQPNYRKRVVSGLNQVIKAGVPLNLPDVTSGGKRLYLQQRYCSYIFDRHSSGLLYPRQKKM
jgi:hypothetical protein